MNESVIRRLRPVVASSQSSTKTCINQMGVATISTRPKIAVFTDGQMSRPIRLMSVKRNETKKLRGMDSFGSETNSPQSENPE